MCLQPDPDDEGKTDRIEMRFVPAHGAPHMADVESESLRQVAKKLEEIGAIDTNDKLLLCGNIRKECGTATGQLGK
jgi:hypothetical protein